MAYENFTKDALNASYNEYVEKHPEPVNYDNPAPTTAPTTTGTAPTSAPTTGYNPAQAEASRITDAHFSPQYVLDEAQRRKNPEYVSEIGQDVINNEMFDALAKYVSGKKDTNPDLWQYGDPGWDASDPVWQDVFEPLEREYQEIQRNQMAQTQQPDIPSAIDQINANKKYADLQVDTTGADWNTMQGEEKFLAGITTGMAGTDINNAPEIVKYTQPILGAYMSSSGVARGAKYLAAAVGIPGAGWVAAGVHFAGFAYNYGKQTGKIQGNKVIDKIQEFTDILDTKSQQFQGALAYAFEKTGGGDLSNGADFFKNWSHLINNFGDVMHYAFGSGKASAEYDSDVVDVVMSQTANMGATTFIGNLPSRLVRSGLSLVGGDGFYLNRNETTRNNQGLSGVQEISDDLLGSNAVMIMLDYAQDLKNAGVTDKNQLEFYVGQKIAEVWGDLSNLSEYLEHEITDPGNVAENYESSAVGVYADITHDTTLSTAAGKVNKGTTLGNLTGGIPVIPDVMRAIGKATGHPDWFQKAGGIDEVLATWNIENINTPVNELTARDKRFSGITDEGVIDNGTLGRTGDFTPNRNTATTKVGKVLENLINFISGTNEWKALNQGDASFDFVMLGLEDALQQKSQDESPEAAVGRVVQFLGQLENPELITSKDSLYKSSQSALFNTIKGDLADAVRNKRPELEKTIKRYLDQTNNRTALNTLARSLGLTPQKVLDMYKNQKTVLTQMIVDKADANNGTLPGIEIPDVLNSKDFGTKVLAMLEPFVSDNPEAWDNRQLALELSTGIADSLSDTLITKYNIKPDKLIYRFGDTIKKMQNLLLLGLSPSYLANNFINNTVTRAALGYGGYMSMDTIKNWMDRFGYAPERMKESLSSEIGQEAQNKGSSYERLKVNIADKKKMKDGLDKIGRKASEVSSKFGIFGNLSNKVESIESQQILAMSMMNYMAKTWKPGVNFRKMPAQLEALIERQNPGMVNTIYAAVSSGMNMGEIERALFGTYVEPSVEDSMKSAARKLGYENSDEIIDQYFVNNGMLDELKRSLQGKKDTEIDDVINDFKARLKALLSIQFSEELAHRAEDIKNKTKEEGFVAAIQAGYETADQMRDIWLNSLDLNTRIFQRRIEEGIPTKEFRQMYQNHQKNLTERWKKVYARSQQTYKGILEGLGVGDKYRDRFLKNFQKKNDMWVQFYEKDQPAIIQPYLDSLEWREGDTRKSWDSRVKKAWSDYQDAIKAKVKEVHDTEAKLQKSMDDAYLAGLKAAVGNLKAAEVDKTIAPIFEKLRAQRQEIINATNEVRAEASKYHDLNQKSQAWLGAEAKRKDAIEKYYESENDLYGAIEAFKPLVESKPAKDATDEVDKADQIKTDAAERKADKEQEQAEIESEIATNMIADGATTEEVEAYIKNVSDYRNMLPTEVKDIFSKAIMQMVRTGKEMNQKEVFDEARQTIQNLTVDKILNLDNGLISEIENKLGRNFTDEEEQYFYWYVNTLSGKGGIFFVPDSVKAKMKKIGLTRADNYLRKSGILSNDTEAKLRNILHDFRTEIYALEQYTDMRSMYYLNRENLREIAIRSGADLKTADAFSRFMSEIADKWEKNHKGKDFFKDSVGLGDNGQNIKILFHPDESRNGGRANYNIVAREINVFQSADFISLVHEIAHGFQYTLEDNQISELAKYFGMTTEEYIRLRDQYMTDASSMSQEDLFKWKDGAELFVRGFLDYMTTSEAPSSTLAEVFEAFRSFVQRVFGKNDKTKWYKEKFAGHKDRSGYFVPTPEQQEFYLNNYAIRFGTEDSSWFWWGRAYQEHNGTTFAKVFDAILGDNETEIQDEARVAQSRIEFAEGRPAPVGDIQFEAIAPSDVDKDTEVINLSNILWKRLRESVYPKDETNEGNMFAPPSITELMQYLWQTPDEDGKYLSKTRSDEIALMIQFIPDDTLQDRVNAIRNNRRTNAKIPKKGTYIDPCFSFSYGKYTISAIVYKDGKKVAYVPIGLDTYDVKDGDNTYKILGVSPEDPDQFVYSDKAEVHEVKKREDAPENPYAGDLKINETGTTDPVADAHNEFAYNCVFDILDQFANEYRMNLDNNMTKYKFSDLDDNTRSAIRSYIDNDVRTDLLNTKYKSGKFGEMMRDAALLNYSKRYGFDNFLTLLCPYQFWMTRSFVNWMSRMSSKGSDMWKAYYKLKKIEERNKKEFMPSKITGKFGLYIPGLPDWMGDQIFMSTDQLIPPSQFIDPILKYMKNKNNRNNALTATAEKYLQEALENNDISYSEYTAAMNTENRANNPLWQEMYARAELVEGSDNSLGGLVGDYLGLNLPLSVSKALLTGDKSEWNQWPMTRTGTAFRAIVGDNWVGKLGENVLSAPEKALRKAAVSTFGNAFEYNEFGAFGDYYLRNKVFDMVAEGRISAEDAVTACIEKENNKIWNEAADRQRQETLVKMQGGSFIDAAKKLVSDIRAGDEKQDSIMADVMYLFASFITAPMSKTVVSEAERTWRKEKAELQDAYTAKENGDKDAVNRYYDEHPNATYNNLRYEEDPQVMLRQYLYKNIMDNWYDLDTAEQNQIRMSFGPDFDRDVISKETRAIEAMDIDRLSAYAQALNGSIPYLATDKINTKNIHEIPIMPVQQTVLDEYNTYREERDRLFPGMTKANTLYYNLPAEDRKAFKQSMPTLDAYQKWDRQYKIDHPNVKQFSSMISEYYDLQEAEDACAMFDNLTMKALKNAAYMNTMPDNIYKRNIEAVMQRVGTSDNYDTFVKNIKKYILGE